MISSFSLVDGIYSAPDVVFSHFTEHLGNLTTVAFFDGFFNSNGKNMSVKPMVERCQPSAAFACPTG